MPFTPQTLILVCFAGILQAIVLALVIYFYPNGDRSVNRFLAAYVIAFTMPMLAPITLHYSTWHNAVVIRAVLLLSSPTLYLYVLSFKETITFRKAWPHYLLFFVQLSLDLQLYFTTIDVIPRSNVPPPEIVSYPTTKFLIFLRIAQMIFYFVISMRALNHYQKTIQHLYSETSRISLGWLRWLINGNVLLALVMIGFYPIVLNNPPLFKFMLMFNVALLTPYIYAATFKGLTQPTLWQLKPGLSHAKVEEEIREEEEVLERRKGAVSEERTAEIVMRATELMEQEKIFRTTDLTLQELATRIGVPAYQLSQAINDGMKKNFYDLVNGYRVEEAKRLLLDPAIRNHKIISLAQDAGFNSKTTFNTVFKKFTGYSPTEFRESQRIQETMENT